MKRRLLSVAILLMSVISVLPTNDVSAGESTGTGSDAAKTECDTFLNGKIGLCDWSGRGDKYTLHNDGANHGWAGGGKSWRIFKIGSGSGLRGFYSKQEISDTTGDTAVLDDDTPVSVVEEMCRGEGAQYYVAFGWDRPWRNKENGNYLGGLSGIAKRTPGQSINQTPYNNVFRKKDSAYSLERLNGLSNAQKDAKGAADTTYRTGLKITEGAAEDLYKEVKGGSASIPNDVGAFCASNGTFDEFLGKSQFTRGDSTTTTGYVRENTQKLHRMRIECALSGCQGTASHYIKRSAGTQTTYSIARTRSNTSEYPLGQIKGETTLTFNSNDKEKKVSQTEYKLRPGQIVCETMTFNVSKLVKNVKTTICVSAERSSEGEGGGDVKIEAKNDDAATRYRNYTSKVIYAKPGDQLHYRATYTPSPAQKYHSLVTDKYTLNGGGTKPNGKNTTELGKIGAIGWKNAFNLRLNFGTVYDHNYTYAKGETDEKVVEGTDGGDYNLAHRVLDTEVGSNIGGVASLNNVSGVQNTPTKVSITTEEVNLSSPNSETNVKKTYQTKADIVADKLERTTSVYVPYNFETGTTIEADEAEEGSPVLAGGTMKVRYSYIIWPKDNAQTINPDDPEHSKYMTTVPNPKWKFMVYVNGEKYSESDVAEGASAFTVSKGEMYNGSKRIEQETEIKIPDGVAGTEVCVQSAVWPKNSGADTNWSANKVTDDWSYSENKCFTLAKNPTIQVLGGNVYSNGDIAGLETVKTNLGDGATHVFGSWGELGVLANGKVTGFASGASLGYDLGSESDNVCDHVPLSFGNSSCTDGTGDLNNPTLKASMSEDKDKVVQSFGAEGSDATTIQTRTLQKGEVQYIHHAGDIYINGNIEYANDGSYTSMSDVPKMIVYAEGDINIACDVTRVDALLVATGAVRTCAGADGTVPDLNAEARSKQLTINGAVLAAQLVASRTYGAGPGEYSIVPAEIINFDPTLYLWRRRTENESTSGEEGSSEVTDPDVDLVVTSRTELAPRL